MVGTVRRRRALSLEKPGGDQPVTSKISGTVEGPAVQVGFPDPGDERIDDVTRSGDALLLRFSIPREGSDLPISLRLTEPAR